MNSRKLIYRTLVHYWKKNLMLMAGVAISGAVITGAMMVGDSVKHSLSLIVEKRLGKVTHVLRSGDRYFTGDLADSVSERLGIAVSPVLLQEGSATASGGRQRVNHVTILGVDASFDAMAPLENYYGSLSGDSIIISENLARRLNAAAGEEVLLRMDRASPVPANAPFVSEEGNAVTLRVVIRAVAGEKELGRFNLKVSQTAPFNVFISRQRLQELEGSGDRVNLMLTEAEGRTGTGDIMEAVREAFTPADAGIRLSSLEGQGKTEATSARIFIDDTIGGILAALPVKGEGIITYFVNAIRHGGSGSTPYSFVSTLPGDWLRPDEIIINTWLAEDLGAGPGDTLGMDWFEVGPLRELTETSGTFVVRAVVKPEGRFGDPGLMPDLPGLSDVGNCRDWETGVPIDLDRIRDKDEDYWDRYRGVPKAFISVDRGRDIWSNRFGTYTCFRFDTDDPDRLAEDLKGLIDPASLGFTVAASRAEGDAAAGQGVDFSQLFGGLSFFLLAAGILLAVLLFIFNLESREEQLGTLVALGIPAGRIRRILMGEGMLVSLLGAAAGLALAVVYNKLVFIALNGVWKDVVRTEMMHMEVRILSLVIGFFITLAVAAASMWFPLSHKIRQMATIHQSRSGGRGGYRSRSNGGTEYKSIAGRKIWGKIYAGIALGAFITALGMITLQLASGESVNIAVFFPAGGLLLLSSVLFFSWLMGKGIQLSGTRFDLRMLGWKNATRNRTRSMSIVILFAIGAFLVVSTGSNRKDLFENADDPGSGTGGFLFYAESTLPVLKNMNDPVVRGEEGLSGGYSLVQLRLAEGDDASCLNLNKIRNPRILGAGTGDLEGRFTFVSYTDEVDRDHPWRVLDKKLPGGLVPAVADETVIKWGLGLTVGDTLHYTNAGGGSMDLLLVGGLAPSIFQGSVIISSENFLDQYPASSGTRVFLVEGPADDSVGIRSELGMAFRDLGWDIQPAAARLSEFNSVTNAYLSIFMVMGALGLLLGIFGLAVVLTRSIQERRREIALLRAVGYGRRTIRRLIAREYLVLLGAGIGSGFLTAVVATLPSLVSSHTGASVAAILFWLAVLAVNGWIWIQVVARSSLRRLSLVKNLSND